MKDNYERDINITKCDDCVHRFNPDKCRTCKHRKFKKIPYLIPKEYDDTESLKKRDKYYCRSKRLTND